MCSILSLRKQVSTRSAKQSQQMLLRRLKSDFHKAINFLAVQPVVSRQSQSYAQTHEKDSGPHWEVSEELRWELHLGSWGVYKPGAQADPGNRTERGGRAEQWLLPSTSALEWHSQTYITATQGHPSPSAFSLPGGLFFNVLKQQGGGRKQHQ